MEHDDDFAYDCSTVDIEVEPLPEGEQEHEPPCHSFYHTTNEPLSSLYISPFTLDGICARVSRSRSLSVRVALALMLCVLVYYLSLYLNFVYYLSLYLHLPVCSYRGSRSLAPSLLMQCDGKTSVVGADLCVRQAF